MDGIKIKKADNAVTEVVGTIQLLMIAVGLFLVVYIIILSVTLSTPTPSISIIDMLDGNSIVLEYRGGKALDLDTQVIIIIGGNTKVITFGESDYLDSQSKEDGTWDMGERLV
ncbi:MAG: type IV pilin [Thermoplasmatales archaeon]|nr:MAG: type IV pilin [Thermoplasmatales archaeon]